jgi:hypothetical protein
MHARMSPVSSAAVARLCDAIGEEMTDAGKTT